MTNGGKRIDVAVIGGGMWGTYHLLACREMEALGAARLKAIVSRTEKTAGRHAEALGIAAYTDVREMFEREELDAVTIATPDHLHREVALEALRHGKHVLVEKPMDLTVAGCREMVQQAAGRGLLLQVDFHKRYDFNNVDARSRVQAGKLGELLYAYAYMEDKIIVPQQWLADWASHSSPFWFIGVHKVDLLRWITGREAVEVRAHARRGKLAALGIDTLDAVSAHILMEGGLPCTIDVSWVLPREFEAVVNQGIRLVGTGGIIEIDAQDRGYRTCVEGEGPSTPNFNAAFTADSPLGYKAVKGYFLEPIKDFLLNVGYLKGGGGLEGLRGRYPCGTDGLRVTEVACAVERSIRENRAVSLAEVQGERS